MWRKIITRNGKHKSPSQTQIDSQTIEHGRNIIIQIKMYFISKNKLNYFDLILFQWSNDDTQNSREKYFQMQFNIKLEHGKYLWSVLPNYTFNCINIREWTKHSTAPGDSTGLRNTVWCILILSMKNSPFVMQHNYGWVLDRKRKFHFWTWKYSRQ